MFVFMGAEMLTGKGGAALSLFLPKNFLLHHVAREYLDDGEGGTGGMSTEGVW